MKKTFSINPSTNMMDVLGHSGYTFDTAIADIIDNSITAHAKNITIYFELQKDNTIVYILDDGDGMNLEKLHQCMIPAYQDINEIRDGDDLGRYSLGLKSASKSFCNQLFVCSKVKNHKPATVELDFEHIKKFNRWEAFELDSFEYEKELGEHGTLVLWNNVTFKNTTSRLDDLVVYEIFEKLEKSLSHTFGKYILEDGLNIYIQSHKSTKKIKVRGWDPFYLPNNKATSIISTKQLKLNDKYIEITSYILPTFSNLSKEDQDYMVGRGLIEQQGFYIYRNKRLIQEGGWLSLPNISADQKCAYARIEVKIGTFLDKEFDVNFSKCQINIPTELINSFIEIANYARKNSRKNYDYVKNPSTKSTIKKPIDVKVWKTYKTDEGIKLSINLEHPVIKKAFEKLKESEIKKITNLITKTIPINMIQTQGGIEEKYDKFDIKELIKETYLDLKSTNLDLQTIKKQMFKTEPFNMYLDELIEFFEEIEV